MKLNSLVKAIRAVSTEFATRLYVPFVWITTIVFIILLCVLGWLVGLNAWWLIGLIPLIFITVALAIGAITAGLLLSALKPQQTPGQRTKVKRFVDALQASSEAVQTPKFILLFRLVKDTISPSEKGFVKELSNNATTLKSGFQEIVASFQE